MFFIIISLILPFVVSVTVSFINILAICVTSLRLYHRYNISRLWWDDCIAAVAAIMDWVALVNLWVGDDETSEVINIQIITFFLKKYFNLSENTFAELIVYKVGFLSIVAVEWFVFIYSIVASPLINFFPIDVGQPVSLSHLHLEEYSLQAKPHVITLFH